MVFPWGSKTDFLSVTYTRALAIVLAFRGRRGGAGLLEDAARGERDLDPLLHEPPVDRLVDVAQGLSLLHVIERPEDHHEVYGEFAEPRNQDERRSRRVHARALPRGVQEGGLHPLEVAAVGHPDLHAAGDAAVGTAEVHDAVLDEHAVGHDEEGLVGRAD